MDGISLAAGTPAFALTPPRSGCGVKEGIALARPADEEQALRRQVKEFVAGTFFGMLMKSMRATVPKDGLMSGGRGEEIFRDFFDRELAGHFAESSNLSLVDATVEQLKRRMDRARGIETYA